MEDPKSFSAPVTSLNDNTTSAKAVDDTNLAKVVSVSSEKSRHDGERKAGSERSDDTKYSIPKNAIEVDSEKPTDLEANVVGSRSLSTDGQELQKDDATVDPNVVDWDGPDDPTNPLNWPPWKIKTHIFLVSAITFIRLVTSNFDSHFLDPFGRSIHSATQGYCH